MKQIVYGTTDVLRIYTIVVQLNGVNDIFHIH